MAHMNYDVVILGAGAAGMMCALTAGKRGRSVALLDHAKNPGEKIRISGGGRCNFTNIHASPQQFLSENKHFCVSALKRYTPTDFLQLVKKHNIAYHEKTLGQLFCDQSAKQIIAMLLDECAEAHVRLHLETSIDNVRKLDNGFSVSTTKGEFRCQSLVIATGGLSIPKMGATGFGYTIAKQFGVPLIPTRAGLVPFTLEENQLEQTRTLSGLAVDPIITQTAKTQFKEAMLFTHRGLSGPAMLQISSYWQENTPITINLLPAISVLDHLKKTKAQQPKQELATCLAALLPKRLAQMISEEFSHPSRKNLADYSFEMLQRVANRVQGWQLIPSGTEGYRTAEVTLGGVDTNALSSQTMETRSVPGLYFIGEVVDVTGWLGGYNFQWAWASGHAAGQAC